ncbi:hypothetical protein SEMRO_3230_G345670.1 [Seminavis robusta]|uniref:Uncharacterized protein n=1 Tax=Seminavis robusta TaxID=568900 RepID=A0A9N8F1S9_9STRA|nr:hypothetical protein SEMRO_3230_G345670.1 [Seminavis robusta]|eukprot:Sro3230_g345670.1 n/a (259) ;mRNA; r:4940-5716
MLYTLRHVCYQIFGTKLAIDVGTSDHSAALVTAHRHFRMWPNVCDDDWEKNPMMQGFAEPSIPGKTMKQTSNSDIAIPDQVHSFGPVDSKKPVRKSTAKVKNLVESIRDGIYPSFDNHHVMKPKSISLLDVLCDPSLIHQPTQGITLCYFHVVQHFQQRNSFVALFIDRAFATQQEPNVKKKKTRTKIKTEVTPVYPTAYHMVQWIHVCRTEEQKGSVSYLVLLDWLTRGEQQQRIFSFAPIAVHPTTAGITPARGNK